VAARRPDRRLIDRPGPSPIRGHTLLPHTADVAIAAHGPDPAAVLEEAAVALAELAADVDPSAVARDPAAAATGTRPSTVELEAGDLAALAFAWLNELIARIDVEGALADVTVARVEPGGPGWRLRAVVTHVPFDGEQVRRRADVKSATYHELVVERRDGGWAMTAVLDV
jgi:SHS2 domain-containing protein